MKKLSFKKKSINDEIITNEPHPVKDRSIKHIFKMNFLPFTFLIYSVVIIAVVLLFMSGLTDEPPDIPEDNTDSNIWTAQELSEDIVSEGIDSSLLYNSLSDGDAIIIKDTITNISYNQNTDNTTVKFSNVVGYIGDLIFEGNLTSLYATGDHVQVYVTIKLKTFTLEPPDVLSEITYNLEIFEKQWGGTEYFVKKMATSLKGLKPLPQSSIILV